MKGTVAVRLRSVEEPEGAHLNRELLLLHCRSNLIADQVYSLGMAILGIEILARSKLISVLPSCASSGWTMMVING